jgi:hypothetical protein
MWTAQAETLLDGRGLRFTIELDSSPAIFASVISGWQDDEGFRSLFNALLVNAPFAAFRWETPPVTNATMSWPFECVLLDNPSLARASSPKAFAEHFGMAEKSVVTFPNLGGDALLIVPCPLAEWSAYGHLGAFVRQAPDEQRHALWQAVGAAMAQKVGVRPIWLSTAGEGVPWLHIRLDSRPKYYAYRPYRDLA